MHHLTLFAGIAFDPGIRGILVVMVGVVVLCGSVYLILGTNLGSRLGLLVALTGLFGWLVILTGIWWLSPPAIGPRGNLPSWRPVEIIVTGGSAQARTAAVEKLVDPNSLPSSAKILSAHPELADEYPNGFTLSDLKGSHPEIVTQYLPPDSLKGWKLVSTASAGEAPPLPKVDPSQPVVSVVLIRDIGNERVIPFLYFVISLALFVLFAWVLHNRDKTLMKNKELAATKAD